MVVVVLKVGDKFSRDEVWNGIEWVCPLIFEVLNIDRDNNSLSVLVTNSEGYSWQEKWDDLNITENAFAIGEYKFVK